MCCEVFFLFKFLRDVSHCIWGMQRDLCFYSLFHCYICIREEETAPFNSPPHSRRRIKFVRVIVYTKEICRNLFSFSNYYNFYVLDGLPPITSFTVCPISGRLAVKIDRRDFQKMLQFFSHTVWHNLLNMSFMVWQIMCINI